MSDLSFSRSLKVARIALALAAVGSAAWAAPSSSPQARTASAVPAPISVAAGGPRDVGRSSDVRPTELAASHGGSIQLGSIRGIVYYTETRGGYRVIATLADGEAGQPVRFEAILTDKQSLTISVPGKAGEPDQAVEISRAADKLIIARPPHAI